MVPSMVSSTSVLLMGASRAAAPSATTGPCWSAHSGEYSSPASPARTRRRPLHLVEKPVPGGIYCDSTPADQNMRPALMFRRRGRSHATRSSLGRQKQARERRVAFPRRADVGNNPFLSASRQFHSVAPCVPAAHDFFALGNCTRPAAAIISFIAELRPHIFKRLSGTSRGVDANGS